ncbi:serine protease [Chryseobacterium sp. MYb264]|uniref:S1 family peptidase n=1 Tax=Chryseobacterium sp. MYb264 TaxID=2745153 RepID=UPI002E0F2CA2|nr:serine protease [Chryseobacterium sp. MYb264]
MINEENEFDPGLGKKEQVESQDNSITDEFVESSETLDSPQQAQPVSSSIPETTSPSADKKKKNPYKIAFFSLGSVIILGAASIFGYKYYKDHQSVPVVENACLDTDTKIYDAYKDAVVMVKHTYGYFAKIKGKEIQLNVPEATVEIVYGTAFFVDKKGNMISNSHVLEPWKSDDVSEQIATNSGNFKRKIASILTNDISADGFETFILSNWNSASADYREGDEGGYENESGGEEFINSESGAIDSATAVADLAASIPHKDYVSEDDIEVYVKTIDISVALHDSNDEWLICDIVKISDDASVDLGVLQLSDKETPNTVTNIIDLNNSITDDKSLHPGEKAVMIGYPLGENLAQTNSGVKVQLYDGQISKETDGNKIQYSVTSTHGASGAPVFNNCGQLIAVNFSGLDQVQGFNFGMVAKQIKSVYSY